MKKEYIVSVDMGGTKILASIINSKSGIIARLKRSTRDGKAKVNYARTLTSIVNELIETSRVPESSVKAVCIGIPGSVNPFTGKIGIAPNLNIRNYNIKLALQKHLPYPVLIENDVNLAALGIKNFGTGKRYNNILVVFIGTGIGGGLIFNGSLYRGANNFAGEIGHITVDPKGPLCGCRRHGCFEALASRLAITRDIENAIRKGTKSYLQKMLKEKRPIKSRSIRLALDNKDKLTTQTVIKASTIIGQQLANINNLLNFDAIILGGGVVEANEPYMLPTIKKEFVKSSLKVLTKTVIKVDHLGDDAAIFGGIALADEFLGIKV